MNIPICFISSVDVVYKWHATLYLVTNILYFWETK